MSAYSTVSADAQVDTTAPSAPSLTPTETSPLEFVSGDTLYYNPQGSNSDSFDVAATATDNQSGDREAVLPGPDRDDRRRRRHQLPILGHLQLGRHDHRDRRQDRHRPQRLRR